MIKLGQRVRDSITGFTGIASSRTEWLGGCIRVGVDAEELKDGKPIESQIFDEGRLEVVAETNFVQAPATGGPRPDPTRAKDPTRA